MVNAYFATGSSDWYARADRHAALLAGWRRACEDAGAAWGGGESPSLPEPVHGAEIELAGSAVGVVPEGRRRSSASGWRPGDEIVLVDSSGLHANGSSLARMIAGRLRDGYRDPAPRAAGRSARRCSIRPRSTSALVAGAARGEVEVHYLSHITGHGLLKLMRPRRELTYEITALPEVPEVLSFLAEQADMSPAAAYSTFNMGCGFAVYCAGGAGQTVVEARRRRSACAPAWPARSARAAAGDPRAGRGAVWERRHGSRPSLVGG